MPIDPGVITLVQTTFLQHIDSVFMIVTGYALRLLYLLVTLEVVVFSLMWMLNQNLAFKDVAAKVLQIGLIFFLLQNSTWIFGLIIKSFAEVGGLVSNVKDLGKVIFNPAEIWQYGLDYSLSLLRAAALGSSIGLVLLQVLLGLGILLTFGLLGIQIVLQVVGFYFTSLVALIFIPFGAFSGTFDFFTQSLQNVFKAGVRVMVLIVVIGVGVLVFKTFDKMDFSNEGNFFYNINQPLGLFFAALLFLCLAWRLPMLIAESVGKIKSYRSNNGETFNQEVMQNMESGQITTPEVQSMEILHAASTFDSRDGNSSAGAALESVSLNANVVASGSTSNFSQLKIQKSDIPGYADLASEKVSMKDQSISEVTLKKLEKKIAELLKKSQTK